MLSKLVKPEQVQEFPKDCGSFTWCDERQMPGGTE